MQTYGIVDHELLDALQVSQCLNFPGRLLCSGFLRLLWTFYSHGLAMCFVGVHTLFTLQVNKAFIAQPKLSRSSSAARPLEKLQRSTLASTESEQAFLNGRVQALTFELNEVIDSLLSSPAPYINPLKRLGNPSLFSSERFRGLFAKVTVNYVAVAPPASPRFQGVCERAQECHESYPSSEFCTARALFFTGSQSHYSVSCLKELSSSTFKRGLLKASDAFLRVADVASSSSLQSSKQHHAEVLQIKVAYSTATCVTKEAFTSNAVYTHSSDDEMVRVLVMHAESFLKLHGLLQEAEKQKVSTVSSTSSNSAQSSSF